MKLWPITAALLFLGLALCDTYAGVSNAPDGTKNPAASNEKNGWRVRGGYLWRQIGDLQFHTGSEAANYSLPRLVSGRNGSSMSSSTFFGAPMTSGTASPGSAAAFADRTYDNGYVRIDAGPAATGDTWFWGYTDASQVSGSTLSFSATSVTTRPMESASTRRSVMSSFSEKSFTRDDPQWGSKLTGSGVFVALESPTVFIAGDIETSFEIGYSFSSADASQRTKDVFRAIQTSRTVTSGSSFLSSTTTSSTTILTDNYGLGSVIPPLAPYSGTLAGPGSLVSNIPDSRSTSTTSSSSTSTTPGSTSRRQSSSSVYFNSNVDESFDVDFHTVSIGPRFGKNWEKVRLSSSLGFALNFANWDASYSEKLWASDGMNQRLIKQWRRENNGSDILPGVYAEVGLDLELRKNLLFFAAGRYDWAEKLRGSVGPSSFELDVGGWSVMTGITYEF